MNYDHAVLAANELVRDMLRRATPPSIIADALMTEALAVWAADTDREEHAKLLMRMWTEIRDGA